MIFEQQLDFNDILIAPRRVINGPSSRSQVSLKRVITFKNGQSWTGIPIIAANMDTVGTMTMAKTLSKFECMTALHKHYSVDQLIKFFGKESYNQTELEHNKSHLQHSFYSMGISEQDYEKFQAVLSKVGTLKQNGFGIKALCIDVANGYMQSFVDFCKKVRNNHPDLIILAGNVVSKDISEELVLNGVDIIKAGIGSGSVCTTRKIAGVGRPQVSTILDCAPAVHNYQGFLCSDGGITKPGDLGKAYGAGSDFVMLGGMLAGHTECEIEPIVKEGKKYYPYYGMSSAHAMKKHSGGVAHYRASEGKVVELADKGNVENTLLEIFGGVRSTCTYVGAYNINELATKVDFYKSNIQTNDIYGKS